RWHGVSLKKPCCARLAKLFTVHGAFALSSCSPMLPWFVDMLALTCAGSVGLLALSADAGYWQLAPRLAGAAKAGSCPGADGAALGAEDGVVVAADAASLFESCLVRKKVATAAITRTTARADPTIA